MLPTALTAKSALIAAIAAISIATLPAAPAKAWGDKEQGFVAGVIATIIVDGLIDTKKTVKAAPPAPVYVAPPPVYTQLGATPAARAFNSYTKAERKLIQRNLKAWGYYHGAVDGSFGRGTYNAVVAFAADEGASNHLKSTSGAFAIYDSLIF